MTNNATGNSTQNGAGDAVFILHRTTVRHSDIAALLTRCFYGFFNWCGRDNLSILRPTLKHVKTGNSRHTQRSSYANPYTR
jgi:hypothetical protein